MSISIPSQAISSSDPEHAQPFQESLCPSSVEISVQEVAETTFLDLLDEDPYSAIYKTLVPYLSEKDCYNLTLTCKRNYRTVSKIFLLSLLGKEDVDYQSLETWRKRSTLADENVLQAELAPLLVSFGLSHSCTEENKEQALDRITTILNALKQSDLFTDTEKSHFINLSVKEIFERPTLFYLLLQTADRHNLVLLFKEKCSLDNATTFSQKAAAVLKFLQDNKKMIEVWVYSVCPTNIPNEVCNLIQLKYLNLSNTLITELPESVGKLTKLEMLKFDKTHIKKLPEWIGNLTQLWLLTLSNTQITEVPEWIGKLIQLKCLNLSHTQITEHPKAIENLTQLETLFLNGTRITELPEWIGSLTQLEHLDLSDTPLTELPESIGNLTQLKELWLNKTHIKKLPESIGKLTQLEHLVLSDTPIIELPESIGNLTQLKELRLNKIHIKKLPESIGKLSQLKGLDLSENPTEELPKSIGNLIQLEELNLSKTQITELPEALSRLPKLVTIYLSIGDTVQLPNSLRGKISRTWH